MSESIWDVLGIDETTDERAIKRAYATRLKVTSPENDAVGYMKLRDAYEAAKNHLTFLRVVAEHQKARPAEMPESVVAPSPPEQIRIESPPATPQEQAIAELKALLSEKELDGFLKKIEAIQAAQTFTTLDSLNDFIGEVALLLDRSDVDDIQWRGRVAGLLGVRVGDNVFARDSVYWHAYEALLESHSEARDAAMRAHVQEHDEFASTPGYLHVYHVLTAPFDSERLMALTRSQTYHRIAEGVFQRSANDPSIVIPQENRDWWERTKMAGQHKPASDPQPTTTTTYVPDNSRMPGWVIWLIMMFCIHALRMCSDL